MSSEVSFILSKHFSQNQQATWLKYPCSIMSLNPLLLEYAWLLTFLELIGIFLLSEIYFSIKVTSGNPPIRTERHLILAKENFSWLCFLLENFALATMACMNYAGQL